MRVLPVIEMKEFKQFVYASCYIPPVANINLHIAGRTYEIVISICTEMRNNQKCRVGNYKDTQVCQEEEKGNVAYFTFHFCNGVCPNLQGIHLINFVAVDLLYDDTLF